MDITFKTINIDSKKENMESESDEDSSDRTSIAMISTHGYVAADPPLGAPDTGGQVVYVLELSKVLARLGYEVDIFTRRFEDQAEKENVAEGVDIVRIACGGEEFISKEYMIDYIDEWTEKAYQWIQANKKKYLFIDSHYWDAGAAGQLLSGKLKIPHLHTPHSLGSWKKQKMEKDYPESKENFEQQYNFKTRISTEYEIYHNADRVIATTPIQKRILSQDYQLEVENIQMIPPGYDDNKFFPIGDASKSMLKEKYSFKDNCILALSRLAHNKGLDLLVEAFSLLIKQHIDAQLVLAIGHEERNETEEEIYQNIIRIAEINGITDKISFIGFIPDEELADVYRAADLFVLSSRYEPFGMTAVEAMACGTPAIVTRHGGLCEVLEDGTQALITDPFNTEETASDMASILKHEGIAQYLASNGSSTAREKFSWTEIGASLLKNIKTEAL